jgi:hypothetical protein
MRKFILAALAIIAIGITAQAQVVIAPNEYPQGATALTASSGNVAAATATATLAGATDKTTYVCGFTITSTGATAAAVVNATLTGVVTGTMTFTYAAVAGATVANQPLVVSFSHCIPASAINTAIVLSLPSLGTGNTNAAVNLWGFRL